MHTDTVERAITLMSPQTVEIKKSEISAYSSHMRTRKGSGHGSVVELENTMQKVWDANNKVHNLFAVICDNKDIYTEVQEREGDAHKTKRNIYSFSGWGATIGGKKLD